jgi:hypothetical protein
MNIWIVVLKNLFNLIKIKNLFQYNTKFLQINQRLNKIYEVKMNLNLIIIEISYKYDNIIFHILFMISNVKK